MYIYTNTYICSYIYFLNMDRQREVDKLINFLSHRENFEKQKDH